MSGASGYVGGRIAAHLADAGWTVVKLSRRAERSGATLRLGEPVSVDALRGCDALVHCAYDFAPLRWRDILDTNVLGTERLFEAACEAGVGRIIFISTISAFEGCRSRYGLAKLEIEAIALSIGAGVIRPGLVYGRGAGGLLGRFVDQAKFARLMPIPAGGPTVQYLVHHDDLAAAVKAAVEKDTLPAVPVTAAHGRAWPLREIMLEICRAHDRKLMLAPVPWQLAWMGLRVAEGLRIRMKVRSDSLLSMIYQNPSPILNVQQELGIGCRPFSATSLME